MIMRTTLPLWSVAALVLIAAGPPCLAHDTTVGDTGQDVCYDDAGEMSCPAPGQAFHGQDSQYGGYQPAYLDHGDGTVTDQRTGLIWQKSPDFDNKRTWAQAQTYADALQLAGHDDWRLPTVKELYSLIDFRGSSMTVPPRPYIDTDYFDFQYPDPSTGDRLIDVQFWSSTAYVGLTMGGDATAFGVNFADGRIKGYPTLTGPGGQPFARYVRCVRGPQGYGENDYVDNGDETISDLATGLMWAKADSASPMNWEDALAHAEGLSLGGHTDWRLPNAKELQVIVDYARAPDATNPAQQGPAIDPIFDLTETESFCWAGTTLLEAPPSQGVSHGVYVCFGQGLGWMEIPPFSGNYVLQNVHGAGSQRSDPKSGDPAQYPHGLGPQGDVVRIFNYVRCVRGPECASTVSVYCTAKTSSSGCTPAISSSGSPSASGASGFEVRVEQVEANRSGILFYGTSGPEAKPFQGGLLCVQPPLQRTAVQSSGSGGSPPCQGVLTLDLNAAGVSAAIGAGNQAWIQAWFRDPPSPSATGLSDALELAVCP